MKSIRHFLLLLLTITVLSSCETSYKFSINVPKKAVLNDKVTISLKEENNQAFEKVLFFVNGKEVEAQNNSFTLDTKNYGVGKQLVSAMVYYGEGKSKRINNTVEVFADAPYKAYSYKIINTYPHDGNAFTQGLEYHNGHLYESTGQRKESTIRKVELKTGKVLQKTDIEDRYFGEGITIMDDKIYFLTWQAHKGFIYDLETLEKQGDFTYGRSKEGWGLTNNGKELIKSDGTSKIWFLDPETQKEKRYIQAYTHERQIPRLNELEYINGKIFANWWRVDNINKSSVIVIINPENGVVEGAIDLNELRNIVKKDQKLKNDDVLNGIAYDKETNHLFVTGKNWKKLFEIELIEQQ